MQLAFIGRTVSKICGLEIRSQDLHAKLCWENARQNK